MHYTEVASYTNPWYQKCSSGKTSLHHVHSIMWIAVEAEADGSGARPVAVGLTHTDPISLQVESLGAGVESLGAFSGRRELHKPVLGAWGLATVNHTCRLTFVSNIIHTHRSVSLLRLQVGADPLQLPSGWHFLQATPTRSNPFTQPYCAFDPGVRPVTLMKP